MNFADWLKQLPRKRERVFAKASYDRMRLAGDDHYRAAVDTFGLVLGSMGFTVKQVEAAREDLDEWRHEQRIRG